MFILDPPPGFQGLREDVPLNFYNRGYLPHWRQDGATYFVTFRLHDALPIAQQKLLRDLKRRWEKTHPPPRSQQQLEELNRLIGAEADKHLDDGYGSCVLRQAENRELLMRSLHFFDKARELELDREGFGDPRFELGAWTLMPNHVHLLVRPLDPARWELENILQSWKRQSSRDFNRLNRSDGRLWMPESYDRIVRDAEHLWKCLQYIGRNGQLANLKEGDFERWVKPEWAELGWNFDST